MNKKAKVLVIFTAIITALFAAVAVLGPLVVFNIPEIGLTTLSNAVYVSALVVLASLATVLIFMISREISNETGSLNENYYNLGKRISFYNLDTFTKAVAKTYKKKASQSYVISYSPIKTDIIYESVQADQVRLMHGLIADEFIKYFSTSEMIKAKPAYCFDKDSFFIYFTGDDGLLTKITKDFDSMTFELAKQNDIRLFVQPYFGIFKGSKEVSVFQAIEKASAARKSGEAKYASVMFYDEKKDTANSFDNELQEILNALKNDEFEVYYQPKFNLSFKTFVGLEALVRWNSPKHGLVSPSKFIDFAENSNLIHELDIYILDKVCKDIADWKRRGKKIIPVSVNFSVFELFLPTFIKDIEDTIEKYGVNPMLIEAEVTETVRFNIASSLYIQSVLRKIREMGIKILLDDFGSHASSFNTLKELPIDIIKIDKSLIDGISVDYKSKEIVKAIISMAKTMNLGIIAEGVDKDEQVKILQDSKCDAIQGYYYSKPIPKKELEKFLSTNPFESKEVL